MDTWKRRIRSSIEPLGVSLEVLLLPVRSLDSELSVSRRLVSGWVEPGRMEAVLLYSKFLKFTFWLFVRLVLTMLSIGRYFV